MTWLETSSVLPALRELVEELPQVAAEQRVEADGRLVEDEQVGTAEERDGERDARDSCPPERRPTIASAWSVSETSSIARSTAPRGASSTRAKKRRFSRTVRSR